MLGSYVVTSHADVCKISAEKQQVYFLPLISYFCSVVRTGVMSQVQAGYCKYHLLLLLLLIWGGAVPWLQSM